MGNLLAIPHGTNEAKSSIRAHRDLVRALRRAARLERQARSEFVVGIAGAGEDHLALLGRIAETFSDADQVARLERAGSPAEVLEVLGQVQPA